MAEQETDNHMKTKLTTITGPQAQALLKALQDENKSWTWVDKSAAARPAVEIWTE